MAESIWTKEEIEILKDLCEHNKSLNQIQKDLPGKTEAQIRSKCQRLNISFNKERKYWSVQELSEFREDWEDATISYTGLRKKYKNRSITALRSCASRLGLAERPHDESYLTISDIMSEMQVSKDRVRMWIRNGLKYHKSKIKPVKYLIDSDDLLLFLKEHPDFTMHRKYQITFSVMSRSGLEKNGDTIYLILEYGQRNQNIILIRNVNILYQCLSVENQMRK